MPITRWRHSAILWEPGGKFVVNQQFVKIRGVERYWRYRRLGKEMESLKEVKVNLGQFHWWPIQNSKSVMAEMKSLLRLSPVLVLKASDSSLEFDVIVMLFCFHKFKLHTECLPPTPILYSDLCQNEQGGKSLTERGKNVDSSLTSVGFTDVIWCRSLPLPPRDFWLTSLLLDYAWFCLIQGERNSLCTCARRMLHGAESGRVPYIKKKYVAFLTSLTYSQLHLRNLRVLVYIISPWVPF